MMESIFDCIVIGSGPAGLSSGVNLAQRGKRALVIGTGNTLLAKAEQVDNYLGLPGITGRQMMDLFVAHAKQAGVSLRSGKVGNIMPFDGKFMVNVGSDVLEAKTIILASGVAKATPALGEAELLGRGVSYCATCDGMLYRGRRVAVWGLAGDAPHEANFLADIGCTVTYIAPKRPDALKAEIAFLPGRVEAVLGQDTVTGVQVTGAQHEVEGVFILRNATPPDALLPGLALENGFIQTGPHRETNIPGVFAAGDVTGKPLQIANAVGDGLVAALSAVDYIDGIQPVI